MAVRNIKQQVRTARQSDKQSATKILVKSTTAKATHQVMRPVKHVSTGINTKLAHARIKATSYSRLGKKVYNGVAQPIKEFKNTPNKAELISNGISNAKNNITDKKNNVVNNAKDFIADNTPERLREKALYGARNSQLVRNVYDRPKKKINDISSGISNLKNDVDKLNEIRRSNDGLKKAISKENNPFANSEMNSKLGHKLSNAGGALNSGVNKLKGAKEDLSDFTKSSKERVSSSIQKDGYIKTGQKAYSTAKKKVGQAMAKEYTKAANKLSGLAKHMKIILIIIFAGIICMEMFATLEGIATVVAKTPHYYCDLNADKEEKKTEIYKRYCGNKSLFGEVDENGIPIMPWFVQYGGPINSGYFNPDTKAFEQSWASTKWHSSSDVLMGGTSCGPSSTSVLLSYITGELILPTDERVMQVYAQNKGEWGNFGSTFLLQKKIAEVFNVQVEIKTSYSLSALDEELDAGHFVQICANNNTHPGIPEGEWTSGAHYITIIGRLPDGTYAISETGRRRNSYWGQDYWYLDKKNSVPGEAIDKNMLQYDQYAVFYAVEYGG